MIDKKNVLARPSVQDAEGRAVDELYVDDQPPNVEDYRRPADVPDADDLPSENNQDADFQQLENDLDNDDSAEDDLPSDERPLARRENAAMAANWDRVAGVLSKHWLDPDIPAAHTIYAAVAAHRLRGQPAWLMTVAPPGSMKTELLTALDGLPEVHLIDEVTPNTFISGQIEDGRSKNAPASLLHRIGENGILVFPDFSTIAGLRAEARASILAQLRRIYDGSLRREFGHVSASDERGWVGRITALAAATPDIERQYTIAQALGERFLQVRLGRPGGTEVAIRAMTQNRDQAKRELRAAVHDLFGGLAGFEPEVPLGYLRRLAALAEFTVRARTHVPRDGYNKQMTYVPEPEAPTRLAQQLGQLTKGAALLRGGAVTDGVDYAVAFRAGLDSIPSTRRRILDTLIHGQQVNDLNIPRQTLDYALDELRIFDLVVRDKHAWRLSDSAEKLFEEFQE